MHALAAVSQQMVLSFNCDPAAPREEPSADTGCTVIEFDTRTPYFRIEGSALMSTDTETD